MCVFFVWVMIFLYYSLVDVWLWYMVFVWLLVLGLLVYLLVLLFNGYLCCDIYICCIEWVFGVLWYDVKDYVWLCFLKGVVVLCYVFL